MLLHCNAIGLQGLLGKGRASAGFGLKQRTRSRSPQRLGMAGSGSAPRSPKHSAGLHGVEIEVFSSCRSARKDGFAKDSPSSQQSEDDV